MIFSKNETKAIQQVANLAAKGTRLGCWCCDGERLFSNILDYSVETQLKDCGKWVINAQTFNDAVKTSKELSISYDEVNNILNINGFKTCPNEYANEKSGFQNTENAINKGVYPITKDIDEILDAVDFVSTDRIRQNLTGVCVDTGIWGCDGHRGKITNPIPKIKKEDHSVIIPSQVIKFFGKLNPSIYASLDESEIYIFVGDVKILTSAIVGPYPDIRRVIPGYFDNKIVISGKDYSELYSFLEKAKKLVKRTKKFTFKIVENHIKLNAVDFDSGINFEIDLNNSFVNGESICNIAFDAAYSQQILKKIQKKNKESFEIKYNTSLGATLWGENYLLMPQYIED